MAGSHSTIARVTPGAISLSNSSHFPLKLYSNCIKPVALPPGCDRLSTKPEPTGSGTFANTIGTVRLAWSNDGMLDPVAAVARGPAVIDLQIVAIGPAQLLQLLDKCFDASLPQRIVRGEASK